MDTKIVLRQIAADAVDQGTVQIGRQASEILMQQISSKRAVRPRTILIALLGHPLESPLDFFFLA
jgi:hypothetical protein